MPDPQDRGRMPQGEARGALKSRVDRLGEGQKREYKYSILLPKRKFCPFCPIWVAPLLIHRESERAHSRKLSFRPRAFSETHIPTNTRDSHQSNSPHGTM